MTSLNLPEAAAEDILLVLLYEGKWSVSMMRLHVTGDDKSLVLLLVDHGVVGVVGDGEGVRWVVHLGHVAILEHILVRENAQIPKIGDGTLTVLNHATFVFLVCARSNLYGLMAKRISPM